MIDVQMSVIMHSQTQKKVGERERIPAQSKKQIKHASI
jgi:hypothetical protein